MTAHFPTQDEYLAAILDPSSAFKDGELKRGKPESGIMGIRSTRGAFACAVPIKMATGRKAIRLFLRDSPELCDRYVRFSEHLALQPVDPITRFEFLPEGVKVGGLWYPAVKMDWVDGVPLHEAAGRLAKLKDRAGLKRLAEKWAAAVEALAQAGVAHGDLQHDNVLVVEGKIRLIDLDGMYVPALNGRKALEVGHASYQHPGRSPEHFGLEMDHFSALVIYLSLHALSIDPTLWEAFHGQSNGQQAAQGNHLLFKSDDYKAPAQSALLKKLSDSSDPRIKLLAGVLFNSCVQTPMEVSPLHDLLKSSVKETKASPPDLFSTEIFVTGAESQSITSPWWSEESQPLSQPPPPTYAGTPPPNVGSLVDWEADIFVASNKQVIGPRVPPAGSFRPTAPGPIPPRPVAPPSKSQPTNQAIWWVIISLSFVIILMSMMIAC